MCRLITLLPSPAVSFRAIDANKADLKRACQAEFDSLEACNVDVNIIKMEMDKENDKCADLPLCCCLLQRVFKLLMQTEQV
jgi:hypothetical protein